MAGTGSGGAGGLQPSGSGSGASDRLGESARKGLPDPTGTEGAGPEAAKGDAVARDSPALGAGGTSEAPKGKPETDMRGVAKGAGAAAAVPAVGVGAQLMVLLMFLNWLKGLFAMLAALILNLLNLIWTLIVAAVKAVAGFFLGIGSAIASAVGGAISAVAGAFTAAGAAALAVLTLGVGTVATVQESQATAQRDALAANCGPMTEAVVREIDDNTRSSVDIEDMEATAEEVYAILAGMGMQDENIAGVLGNFQHESAIDPTAVETIYNEPYQIGPRKQEAQENGFRVELIDADYAATWPAIDLVGIGLGQWTNGRNSMLTDYADRTGGEWSDLDTQLSFMISDDDPARVRFVKDLIEDSSGSIDGSTRDWMVRWEGLSLDVAVNRPRLTERQEHAAVWFAKMDAWEADEARAGSILDQAQTTVTAANQNRRNSVVQECRTANIDGSRGGVVSAGEQIPCDSLGRMHPDACRLHDHLQEEFGGFFLSAGGQRNEPGSNHNNGQAIDYMMAPLNTVPSPEMYDSAMTIIDYLIPLADELNIKGIIWDKRLWAAGADPVGPWSEETTRSAGERGSNTQNHIDHIHISVGPDDFS